MKPSAFFRVLRSFILFVTPFLLTAALIPACRAQTGTPVPGMQALDRVMQQVLARYSVQGGALAVVKDGHLIFARGYGMADAELLDAVQPDSLFRWCSMSKTVTAAAIMRLAEQNKLDLDQAIFSILDQFTPYQGVPGDSRLRSITVRQVLHHTGGWDRAISPQLDPVVAEGSVKVSQATRSAFPPSPETAIRYMLGQRLDFSPGARFAYSNFGYVLLGRVIEKISGQSYMEFVKDSILVPAGLHRVQKCSAHLAGRLPGEVKYYAAAGAALVNSYVSSARERVAAPYGILNPELGDASGGWAGSVVDLAKFISLLDGLRPPPLIGLSSFASMLAQSQPPTRVDASGWYGFGLFVQPNPEGYTWDHGGYNPGSTGYFYRFANGIGVAFLFNGEAADGNSVAAYAAQSLVDAIFSVQEWPETDLFPQYYPPRIAEGGIVNAASLEPGAVAPGSLVAIVGTDLGGLGAEVSVMESDGSVERPAAVLSSAPGQLKVVLPDDCAIGDAAITVHREGWPDEVASITIAAVAPAIFAVNSAGLAAASVVRNSPGQEPSTEPAHQLDDSGNIVANPIAFGPEEEVLSLVLYCTGVRGLSAAEGVWVLLGGVRLAASYVGPEGEHAGMDQIRVVLPRTLEGAGTTDVQVEVEGTLSNTRTLTFR